MEDSGKAGEQEESKALKMDKIMKMLFMASDKLTIRMINSLFGKEIALDANVVPESPDLYRYSVIDGEVEELRADIILNIGGERYHIEFQTVNDGTMVVRMFEYGFVIAIREIKKAIERAGESIKLEYPKQYVIFVEQNRAIPEKENRLA